MDQEPVACHIDLSGGHTPVVETRASAPRLRTLNFQGANRSSLAGGEGVLYRVLPGAAALEVAKGLVRMENYACPSFCTKSGVDPYCYYSVSLTPHLGSVMFEKPIVSWDRLQLSNETKFSENSTQSLTIMSAINEEKE